MRTSLLGVAREDGARLDEGACAVRHVEDLHAAVIQADRKQRGELRANQTSEGVAVVVNIRSLVEADGYAREPWT